MDITSEEKAVSKRIEIERVYPEDLRTHFVSTLVVQHSEAYQTMLASERILRQEWDQPEEDEAWADL